MTAAEQLWDYIYVDDAGGRAIYMAPGATSETKPAMLE